MNTSPPLTGSHLRTYQTIFQHPVSHNLGWRDVHALFRHIGQLVEEPNGNLKVTRNGQTMVLQPSHTKDVSETDEVMSLRRFLERSEAVPAGVNEEDGHWLLVINHHEARIFRSAMHGTVGQQIRPHGTDEYFRHAQNSLEGSRGKEKPDPNSFFQPVANALRAAGRILIFGAGTGASNEMDQFSAWLETRHPDLAARVVGSLVVDEHHLSEDQLLAKAREFYASIAVPKT